MDLSSSSPVVVSAAERYLPTACRALASHFPDLDVEVVAPEVAWGQAPPGGVAEVAAACRGRAGEVGIPFVRHLASGDGVVPLDRPQDVVDEVGALVATADRKELAPRGRVALQVWTSGSVPVRAPDLRARLVGEIEAHGHEVVRGGEPSTLTVCVTPAGVSVGRVRREDALADWPGGRIVLGRPPEQVSRAEWKLEELLKLDEGAAVLDPVLVDTRAGTAESAGTRRALDLGAAPGGWTRVLRRHGFEVWAVDPGDLHPAVAADPEVHHVRTTAGRFFAEDGARYGLVVNDMRMTAERSARVVVDAAVRLLPGAVAVMTLKLPGQKPLRAVERSLEILRAAYEPLLVRQLYHNRNEVTVVARRTSD